MKTKLILVAAVCLILFCMAAGREGGQAKLTYSQFLEQVQAGQVAGVVVMTGNSGPIHAVCRLKDGNTVRTILPYDYRDALLTMQDHRVDVEIEDASSAPRQPLRNATPFLLLLAVWILLIMLRRTPPPRLTGAGPIAR